MPKIVVAQSTDWVGQASSARDIDPIGRDRLIIAEVKVDGAWIIQGYYGDDRWPLNGIPASSPQNRGHIDFLRVPSCYRGIAKEIMYRYMRRGVNNSGRPAPLTVGRLFDELWTFMTYLEGHGTERLADVTPMICATFVQAVKALTNARGGEGPLAKKTLLHRFRAVETLHKLSLFSSDVMCDPWPESAAVELAGTRRRHPSSSPHKTRLIPDDTFASLFTKAWSIVQGAPQILDLRDEIEALRVNYNEPGYVAANGRQNSVLQECGWMSGVGGLKLEVTRIRVACYIVIASLSGCRRHEILNLRPASWYSTEDDDGVRYWWMRSRSDKTDEGNTEWMIPEAAVEALKVMDRWSEPYRELYKLSVESMRSANPRDPAIARAMSHIDAIFVSQGEHAGRTLNESTLTTELTQFAKLCGVNWALASHQFRRTFAEYAARSQFGDLRYLRKHFKHWTMDVTLGYGRNEAQDPSLFLEISDELDSIKASAVEGWLEPGASLAGGYGRALKSWRAGNPVTMFKSRTQMIKAVAQGTSIRSNGHAWCTADGNECIGNDFEKTRCGAGCENAVIGQGHVPIYKGLYSALEELRECKDIGPGGAARVNRDLERCRAVLTELGIDLISDR